MVATLTSLSSNNANNSSNNNVSTNIGNNINTNSSSTGLSVGSNDPGPPSNPLLRWYDEFVQNTPFVTRSVLVVTVGSYLFSWIYNPYYALATIPKFIYDDYEYYRLLTSTFLVNTNFMPTVFAFWCLTPTGVRLEQAMGSTAFGWLCLVVAVVTCTVFFLLCFVFYLMLDGNPAVLLHSSAGTWNLLYGIIALECVQAPIDLKRRFFAWEIPVLYYPVVLLVIFSLLSGNGSVSHIISCAIGYGFGYGKLDIFKLSLPQIRKLEDSYLSSISRKEGWITVAAALGSASMFHHDNMNSMNPSQNSIENTDQHRSFSGLPFFGYVNNHTTESSGSLVGGDHALGGGVPEHGVSSTSTTGISSGNNLMRSRAEARAARLKVLDSNSTTTTTTTKSLRDTSVNHTQGP